MKTLENPLDSKEIKPVNPKGNQLSIFIGKTEGRRRRGQQRMRWFGWHHRLNGHEFEQALGDGEGQGSLACYSPWGHKESDIIEQLS